PEHAPGGTPFSAIDARDNHSLVWVNVCLSFYRAISVCSDVAAALRQHDSQRSEDRRVGKEWERI
ncbi:hypothetical protein, partial [Klebsiella pneumoniae]|uniref:hypothetical protein n=1 Tax=Klebsiella pneumoniae TaxID=573 RepID=UPI00216290AB